MKTSEPGSIQVIDRLTALLEVIARHRDPVSLKVLAADSGLHPSTAFRILAAAVENGLVAREGTGYRLGIRLLQLGSRVASHQDLRRAARPLMEALRDGIGETVNLTVRQGDEVVYLDRALPERMMRVEQRIGSRAPLHVTAVGKLMLGEAGEA
ncbi:MAG: IclR family transcriptional regulator, partial [Xanthomonadaceae bacterium]|nr:IclR family transcriptional regulator [Xanthomonadaceae bacterium]